MALKDIKVLLVLKALKAQLVRKGAMALKDIKVLVVLRE
jgi:hypothetical protein